MAETGGADGVVEAWARHWGTFTSPAWEPLLTASGVVRGTRVLDVGCGTGELLARLVRDGAVATGVDPSPPMAARARADNPGVPVADGDAEHLPFADDAFDVVLALNVVHLADDTAAALAEISRVLAPGGRVGLASWAERARQDLDLVERAVAAAYEEDPVPDEPLRRAGGLEAVVAGAGLEVVAAGLVDATWTAPDDDGLVRGVLVGEDVATRAWLAPAVLQAAAPFRRPDGGYRLAGALRYVVGRSPSR